MTYSVIAQVLDHLRHRPLSQLCGRIRARVLQYATVTHDPLVSTSIPSCHTSISIFGTLLCSARLQHEGYLGCTPPHCLRLHASRSHAPASSHTSMTHCPSSPHVFEVVHFRGCTRVTGLDGFENTRTHASEAGRTSSRIPT